MASVVAVQEESLEEKVLSVAVIGPDDQRRGSIALALAGAHQGYTREITMYPELDAVPRLVQHNHDVMIVDLDSDPEYALDLIEAIVSSNQSTVMVYSASADSDLLVRCMRAGAREFLTLPLASSTMAEALVRASVRRPQGKTAAKTTGQLMVFLGAKGGVGTTTLACNYAVTVARESKLNTLLIDLDLPLGDAALTLGADSEYSTINALENSGRLDANFLSRLLTQHSSGLRLLGAPGKLNSFRVIDEALEKLIAVARQEFDYVIVDAGTNIDPNLAMLLEKASKIYLVSQVSIPALRNANRLITQMMKGGSPKLEIVINRANGRYHDIDDEHVTKALTRAPRWKVPNDYVTARKNQNTATALSLEDSPVSRAILEMAQAVTGKPAETTEKKKKFSLFPMKKQK